MRDVRSVVWIALVSIVVPFALGGVLAAPLFERPETSSKPISFAAFAVLIGVATPVTTVPVLARIVREHRLDATRAGATALLCAAFAHVAAGMLVAIPMVLVNSGAGGSRRL